MKNKILMISIALLAAFGVGFIPQYLRARSLAEELNGTRARMETQLSAAHLQSRLFELNTEFGLLILEVEDQNYGNARQRSTAWFNELSETVTMTSDAGIRQALNALSVRRDDITALLTEGSPDALNQLREMYRALATSIGVD